MTDLEYSMSLFHILSFCFVRIDCFKSVKIEIAYLTSPKNRYFSMWYLMSFLTSWWYYEATKSIEQASTEFSSEVGTQKCYETVLSLTVLMSKDIWEIAVSVRLRIPISAAVEVDLETKGLSVHTHDYLDNQMSQYSQIGRYRPYFLCQRTLTAFWNIK